MKITNEQIDAMPAGREMDALVAEMVMCYNRHEWNNLYGTEHTDYCLKCGVTKTRGVELESPRDFCKNTPPHYSTDIAAAWQVVEKLRGRQSGMRVYQIENKTEWQFGFGDSVWGTADTAPLAICRAALKAVNQ